MNTERGTSFATSRSTPHAMAAARGPQRGHKMSVHDWREAYDEELARGSHASGPGEDVLHMLAQGGSVLEATGAGGAIRWPPEDRTPDEAYADGWAAFCEGEEDNAYGCGHPDLACQWEDGWNDAYDFYGGTYHG